MNSWPLTKLGPYRRTTRQFWRLCWIQTRSQFEYVHYWRILLPQTRVSWGTSSKPICCMLIASENSKFFYIHGIQRFLKTCVNRQFFGIGKRIRRSWRKNISIGEDIDAIDNEAWLKKSAIGFKSADFRTHGLEEVTLFLKMWLCLTPANSHFESFSGIKSIISLW